MPRYKPPSQRLLDTLERVSFCNCDIELPEEPGVYFVTTKKGHIMYIGQSMNMRKRWSSGHHQTLPCIREGAQYIYYQLTAEPYDLEPLYIEELKPWLNGTASSSRGL